MRKLLAVVSGLVVLGAAACSSGGPAPAAPEEQLLELPPFIVDVEADRTSGFAGTTFSLTATVSGNGAPITSWSWDFGDGATGSGAAVQHTFTAADFYPVEVTASDSEGKSATAAILLSVYPAPGAPRTAPGGFALPAVAGDVDGDGMLTVADCHLALKHARGLSRLRTAAAVVAADIDLDGAVEEDDARLLAEAVAAGQPLPRRIEPEQGAPGALVNLISPALLDPEEPVEVQVGDAAPIPLFRPILGYGTFLVPFDAGGAMTAQVQDPTIVVRILVDGVEADRFDFELEDPAPINGEPGAELLEAVQMLPDVLTVLRPALDQYLDEVGADEEQRAVIEGLLLLAEDELARFEPKLAEGLGQLDEETRRLIHQVANANGLGEALAEMHALLDGRQVSASGDTLIETVCNFQRFDGILKPITKVTGAVESVLQVCVLVPGPAQPFCAGMLIAFHSFNLVADMFGLINSLIPIPDHNVVVKAEPASLGAGEQAELRAFVRLRGLETVCLGAAGELKSMAQEQLARLIFRKIGGAKLAAQIMRRHSFNNRTQDLRQKVLDKLRGLINSVLGIALDAVGVNAALDKVQQRICAALEDATDARFGSANPFFFTLPLRNAFFRGPFPDEAGTLASSNDEAPAIFTCQPPDNETRTVTFEFERFGCPDGEPFTGTATIQCSGSKANVTITIGDNGNALDDIYEAKVDGKTVLTSSVPVTSISTSIPLSAGMHTIELIGRAAPDGIGTYFMTVQGANVVSGPPLSGSNLTAGVTFTYTIEVPSP